MEEKLIAFVKDNEFLYNKRSRQYKNINMRDKKFAELAAKTNVPAKKLKERWRTLKDTFYRELKNNNDLSGSGTISRKKKWKWMDHLMFLKETDLVNENTSANYSRDEVSYPSFKENDASTSLYSEHPSTPASPTRFLLDADLNYVFDDGGKVSTPRKVEKGNKMKEMLKEAKAEIAQMVLLAKDAFVASEPKKTIAQHFFEGLARQTDEANLSMQKFTRLQIKMLECFNSLVYLE